MFETLRRRILGVRKRDCRLDTRPQLESPCDVEVNDVESVRNNVLVHGHVAGQSQQDIVRRYVLVDGSQAREAS